MLEHEAFKGSDRIGTTNWQKEKPLLEAQDEGVAPDIASLSIACPVLVRNLQLKSTV